MLISLIAVTILALIVAICALAHASDQASTARNALERASAYHAARADADLRLSEVTNALRDAERRARLRQRRRTIATPAENF